MRQPFQENTLAPAEDEIYLLHHFIFPHFSKGGVRVI